MKINQTHISHNPPPGLTDLTPQEYARRLLEFIKDYTWLYSPKNIRFFVDNLWSSVPEEWHAPLLKLTLPEFLDIYNAVKDDWPPSLKYFLRTCQELSMPREIPPQLKAQKACLLDYKEGEAFSSGMSLKKLHEVEILGELIYQWNQTNGVNTLIDIGAGKGYISQVLQYFYGMNVIGLEGNDSHAQRADTRSANVQRKFYYRRLQQIYSDGGNFRQSYCEGKNETFSGTTEHNDNLFSRL